MAEEGLHQIHLRDDFYRDGFYKALTTLFILFAAIILLLSTSLYLFFSKPAPMTFATGNQFRILPPVPVDLPYLNQPDLIQWVSDALPAIFTLNFVDYNQQMKTAATYFTSQGWKTFLDQLNNYANYTNMTNNKLFVNASAAGAPFILNQGLLQGKYGWWIQMPLNLRYSSATKGNSVPLTIQVLVIRVATVDNLAGVAIDKIIVMNGQGDQVRTHE